LGFFREGFTQADNFWGGSGKRRVVEEVAAYFTTHVLSDTLARSEVFGSGGALSIGRRAAVKTGTTNDTRDAWTIGYTPSLVVGVWAGNNDNSPMSGLTGTLAAAPIWNRIMRGAHSGIREEKFVRPSGVVEMEACADSGELFCGQCENKYTEVYRYQFAPVCREITTPTASASAEPTPWETPMPSETPQPTEEPTPELEEEPTPEPTLEPTTTPQATLVPTPILEPLLLEDNEDD
jgi:membrane peptidoglycan carboxypeptidase